MLGWRKKLFVAKTDHRHVYVQHERSRARIQDLDAYRQVYVCTCVLII